MAADKFSLTIHMVSSLDGIIAKRDNSVSWFETPDRYEKGVGGIDAGEFLKTIDCYVMGYRTYAHALDLSATYGWAYGETPTIVVTHQVLSSNRSNIEFYGGDLVRMVEEQLKPRFKNVWLVGGAMLAKEFLQLGLADEIRLSVIPIILGDGVIFLEQIGKEQPLHLKDVTPYKNGIVELCYEIKK